MWEDVTMNWKKGLAIAFSALVIVGAVAGCGNSSSNDANKPIIFAGETTYPPFEYADGDKYKGFEVDLAEALGKEMGRKVEYKSMGFDALIPALQSNQIDAIASGMVITPEREKQISFTKPYYDVAIAIIVKDSVNNIKNEKDLAGKVVGVQIGTTGADVAHEQKGATVKEFDQVTTCLQDLENGNVQAVVIDEPVADYYIHQGHMQGLKVIPLGIQKQQVAIGVNKKNTELLEQLNAALEKLKANGTYAKLEQKWFGKVQQ